MKKHLLTLKTLLSTAAIVMVSNAYAQVNSFPWLETFEDSSPTVSGWTYEYISGNNTSTPDNIFWKVTTTPSVGYYSSQAAYDGDKMLDFDPRSFTGHSGRYISPVLDLSTITSPVLSFYYRNNAWGGDQNDLMIYYRTSATDPWQLIQTFNSNISTWTTSGSISLPNPTATYQIALVGVAAYGYSITIDNLQITGDNLAVHESHASKKELTLYPNPAKDVLIVKSDKAISEVSIYNAEGKKVINDSKNTTQIDVQHLNPGLYILEAQDKNGNKQTQKFLKN